MNLIELDNLTKQYAPKVGCFNITLTINQGEVYGFLGPNGAGKTTVIKQMVGFIKADYGQGKILGFDIWKETKAIMKDLGYVAGEASLPEYMKAITYLKTVAAIRSNVDWKYVEKLIKYFELEANIKIRKMSKGTKQKVSLIAAFMHKPKILILDEPTSGLDPLMQEKFHQLIQEFQKKGTTVFISSHIFGEIERICDKVAFIKKGKILSEITIHDLKSTSDKLYQVSFFNEKEYQNFLKEKWIIVKEDRTINQIKIKIAQEKVKDFLKAITKFEIDSFKEIPFSLEDYFMQYYHQEAKFND